jgi:glycyl-tRNA synthetase beta chain
MNSEDGKSLLSGFKRAANILAAEEKKGAEIMDTVSEALLADPSEKALNTAITESVSQAQAAVEAEDFKTAMAALAKLRGPVDEFFENVMVNDEDADIRNNRLALLKRVRSATAVIGDFGKISG